VPSDPRSFFTEKIKIHCFPHASKNYGAISSLSPAEGGLFFERSLEKRMYFYASPMMKMTVWEVVKV
jgi:hypothetical protein